MARHAKLGVLLTLAVAMLAVASASAWVYVSTPSYPDDRSHVRRSDAQDFTRIERGRYLTTAADCAACHTAPSGAPFAGGRAIETPFGDVLGANITPDPQTGIGAWSDVEFDAALRLGRGRDHGFLYPAMPFVYYAKLTKEDTSAIHAYLATLAPVRNAVASNQLPFPLNIRTGMAVWDALYFQSGAFEPDPNSSTAWNRGAYLVQGPGHCGACHTPKSWLGGDLGGERFRGYNIQGWFAPNISNDAADGLGGWDIGDIRDYLKTGHNRYAAATGPMAEEVSLGSSHMTDADVEAIATFLKSVGGGAKTKVAAAASSGQMRAGEAIYRDVCSACHGLDGKGVAGLYPDLASAPSVRAADPQSLIRVVLRGARSVATDQAPTAPAMPAFAWQLSDDQIAAVLTYLRNEGTVRANPIEASRVRSERAALALRNN